MEEKEIEELLSDDPKVVEKEEDDSPDQKPAAEEKDGSEVEKLRKENERIKKALKNRNDKLKELSEIKTEVKEPEVDVDDELSSREGWLKKIDEIASSKIKPILDANRNKAVNEFLVKHPEYSTSDYKEKLKSCIASTEGIVEQDEILKVMSMTWAGQNYSELEKIKNDREKSRSSSQKLASKSLGTGEGVRKDDDFTDSEHEKAAKMGISVEAYRKAVSDYDDNYIGQV